jgi:hypothetical protein
MIVPSRRGFLFGAGALLATPAIVRASNLMPVHSLPVEPAQWYDCGPGISQWNASWTAPGEMVFNFGHAHTKQELMAMLQSRGAAQADHIVLWPADADIFDHGQKIFLQGSDLLQPD